MGKRQKQADLEENLIGLAYLDFVGLNKAAEKGTKIHKDMEIKGVVTGRVTKTERIWCPFAEQTGFDCKNIGVEESCTDGKNPCLRVGEDSPSDRPFDGLDPWEFKRQISPTHMNFE